MTIDSENHGTSFPENSTPYVDLNFERRDSNTVILHSSIYRPFLPSDLSPTDQSRMQAYAQIVLDYLRGSRVVIVSSHLSHYLDADCAVDAGSNPEIFHEDRAELLTRLGAELIEDASASQMPSEWQENNDIIRNALENNSQVATLDDSAQFEAEGLEVHTRESMIAAVDYYSRILTSAMTVNPEAFERTIASSSQSNIQGRRLNKVDFWIWIVCVCLLLNLVDRQRYDEGDTGSAGTTRVRNPNPSSPTGGQAVEVDEAPIAQPSISAVNQIADLYQEIIGLLQTIAHQADGNRNSLIGKLAIQAIVAAIVTTPQIAVADELSEKDIPNFRLGAENQESSESLSLLEQGKTAFSMALTFMSNRSATVSMQNLSQQVLQNGLASDILTKQLEFVSAKVLKIDLKNVAVIALDKSAQSIDQFISDPLEPRSWDNPLNSVTLNGVFNIGLEEALIRQDRTAIPELELAPIQIVEPITTIVTEPIATVVTEPIATVIEPVIDVVIEPIVSIIPNPVDPTPTPISQIIENGSSIWATFESGVYKVDTQGQITIDYLWDGGANEGEVGIFDLSGMEGLLTNSTAFTQEAIRRVVSNSRLGHIVISDSTEGARFSGKLVSEPENFNFGAYSGTKSFTMDSGSQFGVVVISQGQFNNVGRLSHSDGFFFSLNQTSGNGFSRNQQMTWQSDDRSILRVEDISINNPISDRDYNDIILRVTGANGLTQGRTIQRSDLFQPNQMVTSNPLNPS